MNGNVLKIREQYPAGTRIELISMDDADAIQPGEKGTVSMVDDIGQIHVKWDSGRTLAVIPGEDTFKSV